MKDSSPGYPYTSLGSNNGKVMEKHGDFIWDAVAERLSLWEKHADDIKSFSPQELIENGLVDPVKVFIKGEPHKISKIKEKRLRIIASVSLVDQIIERLLHRVQNLNEIEWWEKCPSKPGLGLHDDGMISLTHSMEELLESNGQIDCSDVSAWDWTVQEWELDLDMEIRVKLARCEENSLYAKMCKVNATCVARTVFVTPDGKMRAQCGVFGGQLSGRYCTSSSNSRMRILATCLARLRLTGKATVTNKGKEVLGIMSMGDDSVEVHVPGMKEEINKIGHLCKMVETHSQVCGVDFCSQVFDGTGIAYPSAPSKTAYRFFTHKTADIGNGDLWLQLSWYLRYLVGKEKEIITKLAHARIERARKEDGNASSTCSQTSETTEEGWKRSKECAISSECPWNSKFHGKNHLQDGSNGNGRRSVEDCWCSCSAECELARIQGSDRNESTV